MKRKTYILKSVKKKAIYGQINDALHVNKRKKEVNKCHVSRIQIKRSSLMCRERKLIRKLHVNERVITSSNEKWQHRLK